MAKAKIQIKKTEKLVEEVKEIELTVQSENIIRTVHVVHKKENQSVYMKNMDSVDHRELDAEYLDIYIAILTHARNLLK